MRMQIQATEMPQFHVNQYLHLSRIDSRIGSLKAEMSGHEKAFWSLPMHLYDEEEGLWDNTGRSSGRGRRRGRGGG